MRELPDDLVLHAPRLARYPRGGMRLLVDGDGPNWAATDERGERLLGWVDGRASVRALRGRYAGALGLGAGRAWLETHSLLQDALEAGLLSPRPFARRPYPGRARLLEPSGLKEFWVHLLQLCNLSCAHCLVSSGPSGDRGPAGDLVGRVLREAHGLGARRFYFTGGEPLAREDLPELARLVTEELASELVILTNAVLARGERLKALSRLERCRVRFQVSLDGTRPEINDAIRGRGSFEAAASGARELSRLGFELALTAVVTRSNIRDLEGMAALARTLGAGSVHLMWMHRRGRALEWRPARGRPRARGPFPDPGELLELSRRVAREAARHGVAFDNAESVRLRVNAPPGTRHDLGMACWESLCLSSDGRLYPSAATAGLKALALGEAASRSLRELWLESPVARSFRAATLARSPSLRSRPLRFLTGGGDIEQAAAGGRVLHAADPYLPLHEALVLDAMEGLGTEGRRRLNPRSGFKAPVLFHAMGRGGVSCADDAAAWLEGGKPAPVRLLHSNCVLSFDVERPYRAVREFYGRAAEKPRADLCCPVSPDPEDLAHIPREVVERFYGCGSPVAQAQPAPGETVLDLGSGAGIDCFIAARRVGPSGRVIGLDMTDSMLEVARRSQPEVARRLGYDVVEFRKGYLEKVPLQDRSVDLVTSNCVVNLSPSKPAALAEVWRVLKDRGRLVVSDIVSEVPVPLALQAHEELWGECLSGALSEAEFLSGLERAGFHGIETLKRSLWKEIGGVRFLSVTVRAFKFEKRAGCAFAGHRAAYQGPWKAVVDEEGHLFPRGEPVEVCADTAAKLSAAPYAGAFLVAGPPLPAPPGAAQGAPAGTSPPEGAPSCCGPARAGSRC